VVCEFLESNGVATYTHGGRIAWRVERVKPPFIIFHPIVVLYRTHSPCPPGVNGNPSPSLYSQCVATYERHCIKIMNNIIFDLEKLLVMLSVFYMHS